LLSSANDAAVALAERVSGTVEDFAVELEATARRVGMQDERVLQDPAGLDDEFSVGGGNLLSARDLAIAARALLGERRLAELVANPKIRFFGGDGIHHSLTNHNRLLRTYPGAIGVKTGFTKRSGRCLVAAAQRDGRTMIAVVVDTYDMYGYATRLLDQGFATPADAGAEDRLPDPAVTHSPVSVDPAVEPPADPEFASSLRDRQDEMAAIGGVLLLAFLAIRARRRRVWRARRARALARRAASYEAMETVSAGPTTGSDRWSEAVGSSSSPGPGHTRAR
jgi:D-alanyl-D-alanine carboxypeptidase